MNQPQMHKKLHPNCRDSWNPYRERARTYMLDKQHFEAMLDCTPEGKLFHEPDLLFDGSLDAPEYVPGGSTMCVRTVGGWEREEYHKLWRESTDFKAAMVATAEMAEMLRKILAEVD